MNEPANKSFWPNGARLVVSISMQFEAGAQPDGAESPFPPLDPKYSDLPGTKWFEYGFKEGVPRLLDLWDRKKVKVTSHMVGKAVEKSPKLAKEIVQRGQGIGVLNAVFRRQEKYGWACGLSNTRDRGLESGSFRAIPRPEVPLRISTPLTREGHELPMGTVGATQAQKAVG